MPFSTLTADAFVGRDRTLAGLTQRITGAGGDRRSLLLEGPRGIGKTELLRQLYTTLFWKQSAVVPFFYAPVPALAGTADQAGDYLARFLCQWFGFLSRDQSLVAAEGTGLDELEARAHDRDAGWVVEVIERFRAAAGRPRDQLRIALAAPRRAGHAAGRPVIVMIDDLHLLTDATAALLAGVLDHPAAPHVLAGVPELIAGFRLPPLVPFPVEPLVHADAEQLVRSLLRDRGIVSPCLPDDLLQRIGGVPRYLRCIAASVEPDSGTMEDAYWSAYRHEVTDGMIARSWQAVIREAFPELPDRERAVAALHAVTCRSRPSGAPWTARSLCASVPGLTPPVVDRLCRTGLARGGFGAVRPAGDEVLRDCVALLYEQAVLGRPADESAVVPAPGHAVARTDLVLPLAQDAELIAARCLEQLGRNHDVPAAVIGQLQIALIEACVNAGEHGQGPRRVPVSIEVSPGRIIAAVSSIGGDFVLDATGEPVADPAPGAEPRRGWGIRLMKRFCDTVRFERTVNGTRVILVKTWQPDGGPANEKDKAHGQLHPFPQD